MPRARCSFVLTTIGLLVTTGASASPAPPRPAFTLLSWKGNTVVIEVGGKRHELAGYPNPMVGSFPEVRLTTIVASPDGGYLALTGICEEAEPRVPRCARAFIRLYRVADGAHVRDFAVPWDRDSQDGAEAKAIAFDESGARLAVVVRAPWGACPDIGTNIELVVYNVADGARLERRLIARDEIGEVQRLTFSGDRIELRTSDREGPPRSRVIRLRHP